MDAKLIVQDIVARWPDSSHDSTIFNHSRLRAHLEGNEFGNGVVLCDSAYAVGPHMLPPLQAPQSWEEQLYNESQIRTRNVVEKFYGVWKARFPILSLGIQLTNQIQNVIVACAVLHNVARKNNERQIEQQLNEYLHQENVVIQMEQANNVPNPVRENTRRMFVEYFRNRLEVQRM